MTKKYKVVAIMNDKGMYLSEFKTDEHALKFRVSFIDDFTKGLSIPYEIFQENEDAQVDFKRLAGIAEGQLVVIHLKEKVFNLDGERLNPKEMRDSEETSEINLASFIEELMTDSSSDEDVEEEVDFDSLFDSLFDEDDEDEDETVEPKYHAHTEDGRVIWKIEYPFGPELRAYELDVLDGEGVLRSDGDTPELTLDEAVWAMREHESRISKITPITKS